MGLVREVALAIATVLALSLLAAATWQNRKPSPVNSPIVVNTWAFTKATEKAWNILTTSQSTTAALDSVEVVGPQFTLPPTFIHSHSTCSVVPRTTEVKLQDLAPIAGMRRM